MSRLEEIKLRLHPKEKEQIKELARKAGYNSISDYIRSVLLRVNLTDLEYVSFKLNQIVKGLK